MRCAALLASVALLTASGALATPATPQQVAQASLTAMPVIDGHNDLPEQIRKLWGNDFSKFDLRSIPPETLAKTHSDIASIKKGHLGGQFWSVWIDAALPKYEAVAQVIEQIDDVQQLAKHYPETFELALTANDVEAAIKRGKLASMIGMEGGHSIASSPAILRQMYRLGARYMTITHFLTTDWADSATDAPKHDGLTPEGVAIIKEMNRLGMIVDISHVSEATMNDVLDTTTAPVIFSHSSARALDNHPRNVSDAVLKRLASNGGVIMITFVPNYISLEVRAWEVRRNMAETKMKGENVGLAPEKIAALLADWIKANPSPHATLAQVADHIDHVRALIGVDHIGIGGDFAGIEVVVDGLENVSTYPALFTELARRGYTQGELEKISGRNILRVMRAVEAAARP
jgi:membrane dipeptidase